MADEEFRELSRRLRGLDIDEDVAIEQLRQQLGQLELRHPRLTPLIELPIREMVGPEYRAIFLFRDLSGGERRYELTNEHINGLSALLFVIDEGTTLYAIDDIRIYRLIPGREWVPFDPIEYINMPNNPTIIEVFDVANPVSEYAGIEDFLRAVESIRSPYSRRQGLISRKYIAILSWGSKSVLVQFNLMDFIEMVITVCQWFNENWRLHLGYVYQVNQTNTGEIMFSPIPLNFTQ